MSQVTDAITQLSETGFKIYLRLARGTEKAHILARDATIESIFVA